MSAPINQPNDDAPLSAAEAAIERALDERASGRLRDAIGRGEPVGPGKEEEGAMALQAAIERSLKRSYAVEAPPADWLASLAERERSGAAEPVRPAPAADARAERRQFTMLATAASVFFAATLWALYGYDAVFGPGGPIGSTYPKMPVVAMYREAVDAGFEPDWFCEDEKRFAETFANRQGAGLWLRKMPDGVRMAGLAYRGGLSLAATGLFAYAGETPVLVLVEREREVDPRLLEPPADGSLRVFTERIGDLLAIEVTPLDEPKVAPLLYLRAPPAEPTGRVPGE